MSIVLDAMGSDHYPEPEVQAAVDAARDFGEEIILVGNRDIVEPRLAALNPGSLPIRIVHAAQILEMTDKAVASTVAKPDNSMAVGLGLVKKGEAKAFVTAGNSGAAYFNAVTTLRRMEGVRRPAMIVPIPTRTGRCLLIDNGANADCRPEFLEEFALMGSLYAQRTLGISNPKVGLLSNGEEAGKGNQLVKDAYKLLEHAQINFYGNIEPKELYAGEADVVVTDGFTGNIFIKSSEAVAALITTILREDMTASFTRKLGALLVKPAFGRLKSMLDPNEVGAALLLGVNGYVFIGHGRSNARALYNAIRNAREAVKSNLLETLPADLAARVSSSTSA